MAITVVIERSDTQEYFSIRLNGNPGLDIPRSVLRAPTGLTAQLLEALNQLDDVLNANIVPVQDSATRTITVWWQDRTDAAQVAQAAWNTAQTLIPGLQLEHAFWQTD